MRPLKNWTFSWLSCEVFLGDNAHDKTKPDRSLKKVWIHQKQGRWTCPLALAIARSVDKAALTRQPFPSGNRGEAHKPYTLLILEFWNSPYLLTSHASNERNTPRKGTRAAAKLGHRPFNASDQASGIAREREIEQNTIAGTGAILLSQNVRFNIKAG